MVMGLREGKGVEAPEWAGERLGELPSERLPRLLGGKVKVRPRSL